MIRGTTPTFKLRLKDTSIDLTKADNIYVSFSQKSVRLMKSGEDLEVNGNEVDVYLTQEDSLKFVDGEVEIQINWTYDDGSRACTNIVTINVSKNLIGRVLE